MHAAHIAEQRPRPSSGVPTTIKTAYLNNAAAIAVHMETDAEPNTRIDIGRSNTMMYAAPFEIHVAIKTLLARHIAETMRYAGSRGSSRCMANAIASSTVTRLSSCSSIAAKTSAHSNNAGMISNMSIDTRPMNSGARPIAIKVAGPSAKACTRPNRTTTPIYADVIEVRCDHTAEIVHLRRRSPLFRAKAAAWHDFGPFLAHFWPILGQKWLK